MRIKVLNNRQNYMKLPMTDAELNFEMRRMGIKETVPILRQPVFKGIRDDV